MSAAALQANATIRSETEVPAAYTPQYYQINAAASVGQIPRMLVSVHSV